MRNWMLISGLSAAVAVSAWACGSDVEPDPGTGGSATTTSSAGGMGGGTTTTTTSTTSSTTTGGGGFENKCEEACFKLEGECSAPAGSCATFQNQLGISCGEPEAECPAECILEASCIQIYSLVSQNPDPMLMGCLEGCGVGDPCQTCLVGSCGQLLQDCGNDAPCSDFLMCAQACNDGACVATCAADNPSATTTSMLECIDDNCSSQCLGGGGGGGAGGAGGGGGNGN